VAVGGLLHIVRGRAELLRRSATRLITKNDVRTHTFHSSRFQTAHAMRNVVFSMFLYFARSEILKIFARLSISRYLTEFLWMKYEKSPKVLGS
jgi:hypothetical protein